MARVDGTLWDVPLAGARARGRRNAPCSWAPGVPRCRRCRPTRRRRQRGIASFVRVRYAVALQDRLTGRLHDLTPLERYGLVDDLWAAVMAGSASASEFVRFAERFGEEDDLSVWQALLQGLGWCDRFLEGEPRESFRAFVRRPRGARRSTGSVGRRERTNPTSRARCAARSCRRSGCSARIRTLRPPRASSRRSRGRARPWTRRWPRPRSPSSRATGGLRGLRTLRGAGGDAPHAAGAAPLPVRAPALPRAGGHGADAHGVARRRDPHPERPLRARVRDGRTASTAHEAWSFLKAHWDELYASASPHR